MPHALISSRGVPTRMASRSPSRSPATMVRQLPGPAAMPLRTRTSSAAAFRAAVSRSTHTATRASSRSPRLTQAKWDGKKKVVLITGANSGLGLSTARQLARTGEWYVVMACRDWCRSSTAAQRAGMDPDNYEIMHLDLSALDSVRSFVDVFKASGMPLDVLVANAAIYLPTVKDPVFSAEGYEVSFAVNHLGHFLLCNLLMPELEKSQHEKRMIILGSVTGNTNTVAGNVPPKADLGDLQGLKAGGKFPQVMIDGGEFDGAKAYKDAKVCNMLTMREFHRRYHESTGINFSSLYPGCIAETGLFRNHYQLFRTLFPPFQKYITKGYVSEEEAGRRLAAVVADPNFNESSAYWSWDGNSDKFVNEPSEEVQDENKGKLLWELSEKMCNLEPSKVAA